MPQQRIRRGGALLMAVAFLTMGAALLAGSASAARDAARSGKSHEAGLIADAEARMAVAAIVSGWSSEADSLPIGAAILSGAGSERRRSNGVVATTYTRIQRVTQATYIISVDTRAGPAGSVLARRRLRLVLARDAQADSGGVLAPPRPIARWSLSELL